MNTWDEMPLDLRDKLPTVVKAAIKVFTDEEMKSLHLAFSAERPGEFVGIGFKGQGNRLTKFAEVEKAMALAVIEDYVRETLALEKPRLVPLEAVGLGLRVKWGEAKRDFVYPRTFA